MDKSRKLLEKSFDILNSYGTYGRHDRHTKHEIKMLADEIKSYLFGNNPRPTGRCIYCDETLIPEDDRTVSQQLWCGPACRDEWESNNA